jgi:exopolysaccharide biosynthesis polyprenyl glycosylphosphotransferase
MKNIAIEAELSKVLDLTLTLIGFSAAVEIYLYKKAILDNIWPDYTLMLAFYGLFWMIMSSSQQVYRSRRFLSAKRELALLTRAHLLTFAATLILMTLLDPAMIHNRFVFYFGILVYLFTVLAHWITRGVLQYWRSRGKNLRNVLILGSGKGAELYLDKVLRNPQLGYRVIGYLAPQKHGLNVHYLGNYEELQVVLGNLVIDMVVVTASISDPEVEKALELCEVMGKSAAILLDEMISRVAHSRSVDFGGLPLVAYDNYPKRPWQEIFKRGIDLAGSGLGIIVLSPFLLMIALTIKFSSKGPVLFSQNRVGLNGRTFKMFKFRSMVVDAEELKKRYAHLNEMSGPVFKIKNDPRVTPIGQFLRKTSLDEFPQLFNVFMGDMSLVGPRPPLPEEVNMYDPKHRKRLSVKPGITCIWQISGRNEVDFEQWMEMDAEYVDHWSLWLDVEILVKTVPVVLMRKGAS